MAALLLLAAAVAAAVLYPETFIPEGKQVLGSTGITPLVALLPFLAIGTIGCVIYRWRSIRIGLLDAAVLAFLAYLLARNLTGPAAAASVEYFAYGACPFYLGALLSRRGRAYDSVFLWVVTLITALTVVYGLAEYVLQENILYHKLIAETVLEPVKGLHRIGSTLAHPVSYAAFLVQTIPFCVLAVALAKKTMMKILAAVICIAAAVALFFTYSKGSWLVAVAVAGGVLILLLRWNRRHVLWLAVLTLAGLAAMTAVFWEEINIETSARAEQSVNTRLDTWKASVSAIEDNWLTGVGLRQGKREMLIRYDPLFLDYPYSAASVDNNYLSVFLEEGIVGIVLWLTVLALLIREGTRRVKVSGSETRLWGLAMLASIVGFILNSLTFDALLIFSNAVLFWVAAGLLHGLAWRNADNYG